MPNLNSLFSPLEIGPTVIRNRIVVTPHGHNFNTDALPSETLAYYCAERAKGGSGLIEVPLIMVNPADIEVYLRYAPHRVRSRIKGYSDDVVPHYQRMTTMVHNNGAKMFGQLASHGANMGGAKGVSYIPSFDTRLIPLPMEEEDIQNLIALHGRAAKLMKKGGFDGIDLHGSHGFLIEEFLSPLMNTRDDRYGGSFDNRLRFLISVIDEIRDNVGNDMSLGMRLNCDELLKGGLTLADTQEIAKRLEATNKFDFIHTDIGIEPLQRHLVTAPLYMDYAHNVKYSAEIKKVVSKLKIGVAGRIKDPTLADTIISEGKADMTSMVRALIADPELPNKAYEGRLEDIRPCNSCNQNCVGFTHIGLPLMCSVNPAVGREKELGVGTLALAKEKKKVLVIGAGPAGLEVARVAALRGHDVILFEKDEEIGGQVKYARKLPKRGDFVAIIGWYAIQIRKLGVDIRLRAEITTEPELLDYIIEDTKPDTIVVATGSFELRTGMQPWTLLPIEGADEECVVTAEDLLKGQSQAGRNVLIYDDLGKALPLALAEKLATEGRKVELVTRLPFVGSSIVETRQLPFLYERVLALGVKLSPATFVKKISKQSVEIYNIHSGETVTREPVNTVVLITGRRPEDTLYRLFKGKVNEIFRVGESKIGGAEIGDVIRDAHNVAISI